MSPLLAYAIWFALACYGLAMLIGLARLLIGPSAQDRTIGVDFMSMVGALLIVVVSIRYDSWMSLEAALLVALFGYVGVSAVAKFLLRGEIIE